MVGAAAVAQELHAGGNGALARRLDWQEPVLVDRQVRITGARRADSRDRGLVLTLAFDGNAVVLVQEQRLPAPPADPLPLALPDALRRRVDNALVERHPMLMSHVGEGGQPVLSFRGSLHCHGADQLSLWVRSAEGGFVQAIRRNPRVAFMYRDEEAKATYQFQGRARVVDDPLVRQRVFDAAPTAERAHDFAMLGVAVLVDLDRVEGYAGLGPQGQVDPVFMLRQ
nr:pyridoxamine 5'-phosphate oxidase family protein [Ramlibacter agri]